MKKIDYLIVGQGLSGTLIAHEFEHKKISYAIVDTGKNYSSEKAAGIINPIVFRRTTKSWMIDVSYPIAIQKYRALEALLDTKFLFERTIRRAFSSEQERNEWEKKANKDEFKSYITLEEKKIPKYLNAPFGNALVIKAHYVDAEIFIQTNRDYFKKRKTLITTTFDYNCIQNNSYEFEGISFEKVIFCEGYQGLNNPFFNDLPLTQTKGQILELEIPQLENTKEILNRKCFLLPLENGKFKAGSTYEWDNASLNTTIEAKNEIEQHLINLLNIPFKIINQDTGIRPTVIDRRPLIGQHPNENKLFIFNGLGAKGYLLAPYFSMHFIAFLEKKTPLINEINSLRFQKNT